MTTEDSPAFDVDEADSQTSGLLELARILDEIEALLTAPALVKVLGAAT